jgi:hypothetical protein
MTAAKAEADKLRETMKLKEDETAFLRGHVAQLTQNISQFALGLCWSDRSNGKHMAASRVDAHGHTHSTGTADGL